MNVAQIDFSTIYGNAEFVHLSIELYSDVTSVNSVQCPKKLLLIVIILE